MGIDSSAAQAIIKLRDSLANQFFMKLSIFVSGDSDGFPCELNLSDLLNSQNSFSGQSGVVAGHSNGDRRFSGSYVCDNLDQALIYAEVRTISTYYENLVFYYYALIYRKGCVDCVSGTKSTLQ